MELTHSVPSSNNISAVYVYSEYGSTYILWPALLQTVRLIQSDLAIRPSETHAIVTAIARIARFFVLRLTSSYTMMPMAVPINPGAVVMMGNDTASGRLESWASGDVLVCVSA